MSKLYLTSPPSISTMPRGIPYIVSNEAAERFSFYGMRAILYMYMTATLGIDPENAASYFHLFVAAAYFTPFFGALLSDIVLGKYPTIIYLSIVYCLGHLVLALPTDAIGLDPKQALALGLFLIAVGAGGIKPCVSAHVGDQFGKNNTRLISKVFSWFYFAINLGAAASMLITPYLRVHWGPHPAFALPGILMLLATWVFWLGRNKFVHVPPKGMGFFRESLSRDGLKALLKLSLCIYPFIVIFWSLFDQTGSVWVEQAKHMNLTILGITFEPDQAQSINSIFILLFIPLFAYGVYPLMGRFFAPTPTRKILIGLFVSSIPCFIGAWLQTRIDAGATPSIAWQFLQYALLTAAEVLVSITGLEFSYTQAPKSMKSFIMAIWFLTVSLGNLFTSAVNHKIALSEGTLLQGASYFLFFGKVAFLGAVLFIPVVIFYKEKQYIQGTSEEEVICEATSSN